MARREVDFTIENEGRDKGKVFRIKEMSAAAAERWAMRVIQAMGRAGVDVGDLPSMGMQGVAQAGLQAFVHIPFRDAEPLLEEMFECVRIKPDPRNGSVIRDLIEDDTEEVMTRLTLRTEVFKVHTGFSKADSPST